jgi:hypothetical protein
VAGGTSTSGSGGGSLVGVGVTAYGLVSCSGAGMGIGEATSTKSPCWALGAGRDGEGFTKEMRVGVIKLEKRILGAFRLT